MMNLTTNRINIAGQSESSISTVESYACVACATTVCMVWYYTNHVLNERPSVTAGLPTSAVRNCVRPVIVRRNY